VVGRGLEDWQWEGVDGMFRGGWDATRDGIVEGPRRGVVDEIEVEQQN